MVKYFIVCMIFKVILKSNKGQIIEKLAFSEYKYQFLFIYFYENHMHTSFLWYCTIGIDLVIS